MNTRNKSNASFKAVQYRHDVFPITTTEKNVHSYTRSENHNICIGKSAV